MARLRRLIDAIPPASGAAVMGTGIVSIAFALDGQEVLSRVLLILTAASWIGLGLVLATRLVEDPARVRQEARLPAALTGPAGTAVLGTRLTLLGWSWPGVLLLGLAVLCWLLLLVPVLRHWTTPTVGGSLILAVAPESLAALAALLARHGQASWLLELTLVPFTLGLAFYAFVLVRFDLRQLLVGRGDHWIIGGALAISTVAAGEIVLAARHSDAIGTLIPTLRSITLVLWALTLACLPVLLLAEARRPRLQYDVQRWATVFPMGMYAACSFVAGAVAHAPGLIDFARVWVWIAFVLWGVVLLGAVRLGVRLGLFRIASSHPRS